MGMAITKNIYICPVCGESVVSYSKAAFPGYIAEHEAGHAEPEKPKRQSKKLQETA